MKDGYVASSVNLWRLNIWFVAFCMAFNCMTVSKHDFIAFNYAEGEGNIGCTLIEITCSPGGAEIRWVQGRGLLNISNAIVIFFSCTYAKDDCKC
jgi:hypothetical protein